jgi:3-oxoacyl-[acyl-carrier protein] reductase
MKTALVCGASQGIGRATAMRLASTGHRVAVLARNAEKLAALVPLLREAGAPAALAVPADLDDLDGLDRALASVVSDFGPFGILVHNSGGPPAGPLLQASDAALVQAFGRTVLAGQRLIRALLPGMVASGYGRVVNVLSTSVYEPIPNLGIGNTVRGAMGAWAKTLSDELPACVTINNVLPGYTATGRLDEIAANAAARAGKSAEQVRADWAAHVPAKRIAEPDELAAVIAFLCSPDAGYLRGQSIAVDGGRMRSI